MAPAITTLLLTLANLLVPIAILTFASGFFPYKPFLPGLAEWTDTSPDQGPEPPFDKVVFMVVDALRSDFVYSEGSGFTFTQSLICNGSAMPFTAHAASPTITMPRIKAITTGSIPSFLDVILNFAESDTTSTLATQDTWLAQMKVKGEGKLVMYGDDTWIKLFPESFDRADGTSSFFVADFTEVDNNVTRHVPEELGNDDWNTVVLHYLGLDHIGHKAGPRSPNMIPKQREMDGIVRQIYTAIESHKHLQNTLLVLCGDHGMNDAGNHGGSSQGETSPAMVFISPKLRAITAGRQSPLPMRDDFQYYSTIEQSDVAPTFAALLRFPVPRNNLGNVIIDFLPFWTQKWARVGILFRNAWQILNIVKKTFSASVFDITDPRLKSNCSHKSDIEKLGCDWVAIMQMLETDDPESDENCDRMIIALAKWLRDAQGIMTNTASNYDMFKLTTGQLIAGTAALLALVACAPTLHQSRVTVIPFLLITLTYSTMTFASSYVEEEHHFWYWATSGWLALLCIKGTSRSMHSSSWDGLRAIGLLAALRIMRRWNQTGQKFAGEPDIARSFLASHPDLLWVLIAVAYAQNAYSLIRGGFPRLRPWSRTPLAVVLALLALSFKLAFTNEDAPELISVRARSILDVTGGWDLVTRTRVVFLMIAVCILFTIGSELFYDTRDKPRFRNDSIHTIHNLLTTFLMTQSRALNIPLLLLFQAMTALLLSLDLSRPEITTTALLLRYSSFFALAGSNAISSIDLSSAYNGVAGYNVGAVGFLTFVSNWAGPVFWMSAANLLLLRARGPEGRKGVWKGHVALLTLFATVGLLGVMLACTVLRTHLFIWTVFSPKYLYSMAWALGQHLFVDVGVGGVLFWLGSR